MKMRIKGIKKTEFKRKLAEKTGCAIQYNGWCCGTCFYGISKTLNNDDWLSLLYYRGDTTIDDVKGTCDYLKKPIPDFEKSIKKIWELIK